MTSVELAKQKSNNSDWKRLSINNLFNQKHERCDKQERSSQKQLDKKGKNRKKIQYNFKQYNFQPFDLKQIENNLALIKSNRKFSSLLDTLRQYNQKLKENNQTDIINYKLYEFFYSTLRICNTKTNTEVQFYLRQLNTWKQQYNHKRQFLIHRKNKKKDNKPEQELIRQTFKSYLPSQINQYERKNCIFSKNQQSDDKNRRKNYKMPNGKPFYDSDGQDTEQYMKKLQDKEHEKDRKKQETRLPDLRTYQNQLKKMRKIIQDRQEKQLLQDLMKNKTRIQTQSANNFYKPMRNRNDIFNKTSASKFQTELFFKKPEGQEENNNESSKIQGAEQNLKATNAQKQNHRIVVNSTSLGFYEIKKSNLEKALGVKKMKTTSTNFPKFFMNHDTSYNSLTQKIDEQQNQKDPNVGNYQQKITNIMGMHLLRNPFEITKIKRQKKKK